MVDTMSVLRNVGDASEIVLPLQRPGMAALLKAAKQVTAQGGPVPLYMPKVINAREQRIFKPHVAYLGTSMPSVAE